MSASPHIALLGAFHYPVPQGSQVYVAEQARALVRAERVTVLTGAGISAASGVATFRGAGGLWEGLRPEEVATPLADLDAYGVQLYRDISSQEDAISELALRLAVLGGLVVKRLIEKQLTRMQVELLRDANIAIGHHLQRIAAEFGRDWAWEDMTKRWPAATYREDPDALRAWVEAAFQRSCSSVFGNAPRLASSSTSPGSRASEASKMSFTTGCCQTQLT